ncbi:MAG: ATP-binding cassette domain-containing protein, partial [Patescibacteria group bacterium]
MSLKLINYQMAYPGHDPLLNSTNFELEKGQKYSLMGYNGVGKSSILRDIWEKFINSDKSVSLPLSTCYLPQHLPEDLDFIIKELKNFPTFYELIYQWQINEYSQIAKELDFDEKLLNWFLEVSVVIPPTFNQDFENKIFELGLSTGFWDQNFKNLSAGSKKKIFLALIFSSKPDLIIIDELTNHLDKQSIAIVSKWVKESNSSMLIIDHNAQFLENTINNFLFLPNNKERKWTNYPKLTYIDFMELIESKKESQALAQKALDKKKKSLEKQLEFYQWRADVFNADIGAQARTIKNKMKWEVTSNPLNDEKDLRKTVKMIGSKTKSIKPKSNSLFTIQDLEYIIGVNKTQFIHDFKIYKGDRIWIKGPNGRGKSTLLNLILDSIEKKINSNKQFLSGSINLGSTFDRTKVFTIAQNQNYGNPMSIQNFVRERVKLEWFQINALLKNLGFDSKYNFETNVSQLSLGEYIRLQLGILGNNIDQYDLIILDEPGNFLDVFTQQALIDMLTKYKGALLLVTHDEILGDKLEVEDELRLN